MIPVYKPYLNKEMLECAHEALDSTWISSRGNYISMVESHFRNMYSSGDFNKKEALVVNNGTAATHMLALLLKKKYPDIKKIITPNNVYVAAINSFLFDKNYELEAVDADVETFNYDKVALYDKLKKENLDETALLVVHNLGNIFNVPALKRDFPDLVVLEDNCEGFFGEYEGEQSGTACFASSLSFFGNKNITSGEGGAVLVPEKMLHYASSLRSQGQSEERFIHDVLGYNYRMTNIQAAILCKQLQFKDEIKELKQKMFRDYKLELKGLIGNGLEIQKIEDNTSHSNWMFSVRFLGNKSYKDIEKFFNSNYIEVRPMFYPINKHKYLSNIKCDSFKNAETINKECVVLPSYIGLKSHEIKHIVNTCESYLKDIRCQ